MDTDPRQEAPGKVAVVHVIEDDADCSESVRAMLAQVGLCAVTYRSAAEFLNAFDDSVEVANCLLVNLHCGGTGMGLLRELSARGIRIPVIFVSGQADVATAVAAMKQGAVDFLEKPLHPQLLLPRVEQALGRDAQYRFHRAHRDQARDRMRRLSQREREVLDLLVSGQSAKQIACQLVISPKTAMKHRNRICDKLEVDGMVQLVRLFLPPRDDGST